MSRPSYYSGDGDEEYKYPKNAPSGQCLDVWHFSGCFTSDSLLLLSCFTFQNKGHVLLDNVRFFPFVWDDFESGDFSRQKWKQPSIDGSGGPPGKVVQPGAPWTISEEYAIGRYSAYVGASLEYPHWSRSDLKLHVDL